MRLAHRFYKPALGRVMRNRKVAGVVAAALVVVSAVIFPFLGAEFIPRLDRDKPEVEVVCF